MREEKKDKGWKKSNLNYKRKKCPFESGVMKIDYKDPRTLQKFISERGKIMPCRISMVSSRKQRALALAVKRARYLALLPYVSD
ncbi:MAG: 30S ribosomal protein S18 [Alphaproteobacteria bacterium]|nr:30S ribosomal protein S18 [Alphaproteobacteria bacterium]MBO7454578.1 30S ribosomal protein S18 [Alphaproteobacteria bacterium]MBO7537013.1 30S ribosomal protein S18 [Alphaproteobacteria bacterium]MBO7642075.1 30S ribosomal protein S18 [Alphaproteobacteria bacterium]MCR4555420.1 30S ribosomal protein S18 [Alphaproteobacteria bacterium]